jgi:hypothetical protein
MGETGKKSIVWDRVIVYERGVTWTDAAPPKAAVSVGPVANVVEQFVDGIHQALGDNAVWRGKMIEPATVRALSHCGVRREGVIQISVVTPGQSASQYWHTPCRLHASSQSVIH